jgi:hypothetical protein
MPFELNLDIWWHFRTVCPKIGTYQRGFEKQYLQQFIIDTNLDDYFVLIEVWSGHDYYQSIDENALI